MSGAEAFLAISIIVNIADLLDRINTMFGRVKNFGGRARNMPKAFRTQKTMLPLLAVTLNKTMSRIKAAKVDEETCAALCLIITDFREQLAELNAVLERTLPQDGDKWWKIVLKAWSSVRQDEKVEAISAAINAYIGAITMNFTNDALSLMSMPMSADQRPIQLTDAIGRTHLVPFFISQTVQGLVCFLMWALKDCPEVDLKRRIELGEFWLMPCDGEHLTKAGRTIREGPAILADTWEGNAQPGKSFVMITADDLTPDERRLVHGTWEVHLLESLPEICKVTGWELIKSGETSAAEMTTP